MLELIPLAKEQIEMNNEILDSSLTCKELRDIVKQIVNPAVETTATATESTENSTDSTEEESIKPVLTDKERVIQMLEICSNMENEDVKNKIIAVFQKALKSLEKQ